MKTEDQLIADVFLREGDVYAEPPQIDQPTGRGGITLPVLKDYAGHHVTVADLKAMTHDYAASVIRWKLRQLSLKSGFMKIADEPVRLQMIDFAYNSGAELAIRWLQRVLRVARTSKMDTDTLVAVGVADPWLLHHALIAARLSMIDKATDPGGKVDRRYEEGLENRALEFSMLEVP